MQLFTSFYGAGKLAGKLMHLRSRKQQDRIGQEGRLIVEGAAHASEYQLLVGTANFAGEALDILSFQIGIIGVKYFVQAEALFVGIPLVAQNFYSPLAVVRYIDAILAQQPGDLPVLPALG